MKTSLSKVKKVIRCLNTSRREATTYPHPWWVEWGVICFTGDNGKERTRLNEKLSLSPALELLEHWLGKCLSGLTRVCSDWPGGGGEDFQPCFPTAVQVFCIQVGRSSFQFSVLYVQCTDEIINLKWHTFCGCTAEISWANLKAALWSTNIRML